MSENATYDELKLIAGDSPAPPLEEEDALFKDFFDHEDDDDDIEAVNVYAGDFHEGDIAGVSLATVSSYDDDDEEDTKNAIIHTFQRWPDGEIPYVISASFNRRQRGVIYEAMREFDLESCVRWRPRTYGDRDYVHILKDNGCYSRVGRVGYGGQVLSLGRGCVHKGTVVHEMLHAAGFWHEQSRPDRDEFVAIRWENIKNGKEDNFARYSRGEVSTLELPYDLRSVMHYDARAFSRNGRPTIVPVNSNNARLAELGQDDGMTKLDVKKLNTLYDCKVEESCKDPLGGAFCADLRANGWCEDFPDYMKKSCGKTCGLCTSKAVSQCRDRHERCGAWAQYSSQCETNVAFMKVNCAESCGYCAESDLKTASGATRHLARLAQVIALKIVLQRF